MPARVAVVDVELMLCRPKTFSAGLTNVLTYVSITLGNYWEACADVNYRQVWHLLQFLGCIAQEFNEHGSTRQYGFSCVYAVGGLVGCARWTRCLLFFVRSHSSRQGLRVRACRYIFICACVVLNVNPLVYFCMWFQRWCYCYLGCYFDPPRMCVYWGFRRWKY